MKLFCSKEPHENAGKDRQACPLEKKPSIVYHNIGFITKRGVWRSHKYPVADGLGDRIIRWIGYCYPRRVKSYRNKQ